MAGRLLSATSSKIIKCWVAPIGCCGAHGSGGVPAETPDISIIGKREWVGYGFNGQPNYVDRSDFPMPAIRWSEPTSDILALRQKEQGDWKLLSIEEKKALYRASFCQTFAEFQAPDGRWKSIFGWALFFSSLSLWVYMFMKVFVYDPLPDSFKEENQQAQLRRMLDLHVNAVDGLSSKWDYEKDEWKK